MRLIISTLIFCNTVVFSLNAQEITIASDSTAINDDKSRNVVYSVSMIKLIVTPEKYHDKEVIVSGFLNLEFEGKAIYMHKEDYDNGLNKNGFWVSFTDEVTREQLSNSNGKYVMIRGTFDMQRAGHFGLWSGTIKNIVSVTPLPNRE